MKGLEKKANRVVLFIVYLFLLVFAIAELATGGGYFNPIVYCFLLIIWIKLDDK
jgi:hypothetical protein